MTAKQGEKRRTPRTLKIQIEIDVTEGPRIRRGTTQGYVNEAIGMPVLDLAVQRMREALGLVPTTATARTTWEYTWFDTTAKLLFPGNPAYDKAQEILTRHEAGEDGPFEIIPGTTVEYVQQ